VGPNVGNSGRKSVSKIISLKVPHRTKPLDLDSLRIEPANSTDRPGARYDHGQLNRSC
jgi:hypothetical protein